MKFFVILILLCIVLFFLFFPLVDRERQCYESSQANLDRISSNILNQRITKDMECSQRMDTLFNLESCMQDATKSSIVAQYANNTIQQLLAIIRPYGKNLWTLKAEHNQSCADYSWYQLP